VSAKPGELQFKQFRSNIGWGIKWGLAFAGCFIIWAAIIRILAGNGPFQQLGASISITIAFYISSGLLSGLILGVSRPLLGSRLGSAIVGCAIAIPVVGGTQMALEGVHRPDLLEVVLVVTMGLFGGVLAGLALHEIFAAP
jgi:hypothetical protein